MEKKEERKKIIKVKIKLINNISPLKTNIKSIKGKKNNMNVDISSNSSTENRSMFKVPLMERLKKKNTKIDGMPSFKLTNFEKKAKRNGLLDLSDFDLDFNDKEQIL